MKEFSWFRALSGDNFDDIVHKQLENVKTEKAFLLLSREPWEYTDFLIYRVSSICRCNGLAFWTFIQTLPEGIILKCNSRVKWRANLFWEKTGENANFSVAKRIAGKGQFISQSGRNLRQTQVGPAWKIVGDQFHKSKSEVAQGQCKYFSDYSSRRDLTFIIANICPYNARAGNESSRFPSHE